MRAPPKWPSPGRGPAVCAAALALAATAAAAADPAAAARLPRAALGVNVGQVNYYNGQMVFLDLVQQAEGWGLGNGGQEPPTDAQGWPTSVPAGRSVGFVARAGPGGRHVALYEGDGELAVTHGGRVIDRKPGRVELALEPGEVHLRILRTNPADPLRRLHVVPAEHEQDFAAQIFHPRFLELVRPFGVLRFVDWLRINGSSQVRWSDRASPDQFSQGTGRGAALEYAVELCNRVRADCWINLPHLADDEYVTRAAALLRDRLDRSLRVYVEYSNEVWNFPHGDHCQQAGEKLGMPRGWETRLRYQAHRSLEIFRIFERALGRDRLVRVLAGQSWDARLLPLLEWEGAYRQADAIAIAPYFCDETASDEQLPALRRLDAAGVAALCTADVERIRKRVRGLRALADRYHLPLIAYEGGQHLVTSGNFHEDAAVQRLLDQANRDAEMGRAYARYLEMWREEGGQLLVLYDLLQPSSRWGRWGLLEEMWGPYDGAPKYRAAREFLRTRPPWWGGAGGN